ncbi:MAG TPA: ABC transporter permease subunit [Actinotalea sp.]|nr:ABC transporter permease subunit [Actinotalea sp.]
MTARPGTVLVGVLRTRGRSILWWAVAVSALAAMYTAFYPTIGSTKMAVMMDSMPPELVEALGMEAMASAAGYVSATVYALLGAILTLVCAIGTGARLVAGEEEDGTLELELSAPVPRRWVYLERLAALWITVAAVVLAVTATLALLSTTLDLGLDLGNLAAASVSLLVFAGAMGTVALGVGAATGRRAIGLGAASGLAVVSYLLTYIGPLAELTWMERISPYSWYIGSTPLLDGLDTGGLALLVALALAATAIGAVPFVRRDLMV